jgi:hypothetical protein
MGSSRVPIPKVATVLGSISTSSDTVESDGLQYIKNPKNPPVYCGSSKFAWCPVPRTRLYLSLICRSYIWTLSASPNRRHLQVTLFFVVSTLFLCDFMWTWFKTGRLSAIEKSTILQKHNNENSKQIFLGKELRCYSPIPTFLFLWVIYIFLWSVCLFCCRKIGGPNVGIYKSLTDTWMWILGLRRRNSFSGNT